MTKPTTNTIKGKSTKNEVPENAQNLMHLWDPHIDSFNFFLGDGLKYAIEATEPMVMDIEGSRLTCIINIYISAITVTWFDTAKIEFPMLEFFLHTYMITLSSKCTQVTYVIIIICLHLIAPSPLVLICA